LAQDTLNSHFVSTNCSAGTYWGGTTAGDATRTLYITTKVLDTDTARNFSTTLTFSVSPVS
jgi:hypothetical protein